MARPAYNQLYLVLLTLYIAQSIPMSFFTSAVPAIMRQDGYSLELIGILQLVKLPWILKVLWAPLVDRKAPDTYSLAKWIISAEVFYAGVILLIGSLSLETNFMLIAVLIIIAIMASATQDICTDAFSIRALAPEKHCIGASIQSMGGFFGGLVGGGLLLMLYAWLDWKILLTCLALFVVVSLIPLLLWRKTGDGSTVGCPKEKIKLKDIALYFKQENSAKHTVFLVLYTSSIMVVLAMLRPYMVDLGQSIHQIGIVMGVAGTSAAAVSSLLAGVFIRKYGKKIMLVICSLLILIAIAFILLVSCLDNAPVGLVYLAITLVWSAHGFATVMMYSIAMGKIREGRAGTDFTLQTVMIQLSGLFLSAIGGQIAGRGSYQCLFAVGLLLALCSLVYTMTVYKKTIA